MELGYCGGDPSMPPCETLAQFFGSFALIVITFVLGLLILFIVGRLLYLCFNFRGRSINHSEVRQIIRNQLVEDIAARAEIVSIAQQAFRLDQQRQDQLRREQASAKQ